MQPRIDSVKVTLKDGRKGRGATIAAAIQDAQSKRLKGSNAAELFARGQQILREKGLR